MTQILYVKDLTGEYMPADFPVILAHAQRGIARKFRRGTLLKETNAAKEYVQLQIVDRANECFACLFLDNGHRVLGFEILFTGTIDGTSVYPRVVVQRALAHNAAALIVTHNHPSGRCEPSNADRAITRKLSDALGFVDIRLLDHLIVAGENVYSFAEHGLI